jgi:hypothetical protein
MAVTITFVGGEENGDVGSTEWRNTATGYAIKFPVNKAVTIDPDKTEDSAEKAFLNHVIHKARGNRFFEVKDVADKKTKDKPA